MSNVIPLHSRRADTPPPLAQAEPPTAEVARLPQRDRYVMRRRPPAPRRKGRNGHHPDCPYGAAVDANCRICAGLAKGERDKPDPPAAAAARTA